ncbi:hypothetical protein [Streptomyces sp. NRRL F-5755]|uniref:hypothetical protein n=1 Tax=Streptomyces sp. NRRL F-5755 TaxID=1519475 RepID=UPI000A824A2C|nr:hypothetical protein [Streptomyces sp. NRRL F-5755]
MARGQPGSGAVQFNGFTGPVVMQSIARSAELPFVNDDMTWPARTTGEGPGGVCVRRR